MSRKDAGEGGMARGRTPSRVSLSTQTKFSSYGYRGQHLWRLRVDVPFLYVQNPRPLVRVGSFNLAHPRVFRRYFKRSPRGVVWPPRKRGGR